MRLGVKQIVIVGADKFYTYFGLSDDISFHVRKILASRTSRSHRTAAPFAFRVYKYLTSFAKTQTRLAQKGIERTIVSMLLNCCP